MLCGPEPIRVSLSFLSTLLTLFLLLFAGVTHAQVELYVLRPTLGHERFIFPVRHGQSFNSALQEYKSLIAADRDLSQVVTNEQLLQLSTGQVSKFPNDKKTKMLLLANKGTDLEIATSESRLNRIQHVVEKTKGSVEIYVLPIAAVITLSEADKSSFYRKLNSEFAGVMALGGNDVAPEIYGEALTESRNVNPTRDRFEIEFIKKWISFEKGFLIGICRGHQLIAAALGFKLNQNIENHGARQWTTHKIKPVKTESGIFARLFGGETKSITVNSLHHQVVIDSPNRFVEVAAYASDGTVEALESKDGRIFTTQFHPEYMSNYISKIIFSYFKKTLFARQQRMCRRLF